MKYKKISFFLSLLMMGYSSFSLANNGTVRIDCELDKNQGNITFHFYPRIYIKQNQLCFDATGWDAYQGQNCVDSQDNAQWEAIVLLAPNGNSIGRDDTQFRVQNAEFTPERIAYTVEWGRNNIWHPLQHMEINRLTGRGIEWAIGEHGGTSLICEGRGAAF